MEDVKELMIEWLLANNAERISSHTNDDSSIMASGIVKDKFCCVITHRDSITLTTFGETARDLNFKNFVQILENVKPVETEHTLELDELEENQQLIIRNKGGKITMELKQDLN